MTSTQLAAFQSQPLVPPSDSMEMGTSPLIHADDIDVDLDDLDAQFVDNDKSMIDDQFELLDEMQNDSLSTLGNQDHHMIDPLQQHSTHTDSSLNDTHIQLDQGQDEQEIADDDILLDDDDDHHHTETGDSQVQHQPKHDSGVVQHEEEEVHLTNQDTNPTPGNDLSPKPPSAPTDQHNVDTKSPEIDVASAESNNHEIHPSQSNENPADTVYETAVPLHPILVAFDDEQRLLFPNTDDETVPYLLEDESLASASFDLLLAACRECLRDRMEHNDEIVLEVPKLGLQVCEDSRYVSTLTLARVTDTYMLLKQNEELSTIEPLECRLSYRPCLETQMNWLINSATEGKTFSEIAADYELVASEYSAEETDDQLEPLTHDAADPTPDHENEPDAESEQEYEPAEEVGDSELPPEEDSVPDPEPTDHLDTNALPSTTGASAIQDSATHDPDFQHESPGAEEDLISEQGYVELEPDDKQSTPPDSAVPLLVSEPETQDVSVDDIEPANTIQDDNVELDLTSDDESTPNDHVTTAANGSVQHTPSKSLNGKRKTLDQADDDDDLLLDISTPEPKRQRPS